MNPAQRERQRREIDDNMAAARAWRDRDRAPLRADGLCCGRCDGSGRVWWCGRPGMGGKLGPCPRCQVDGAARFRLTLNRELFT